MKSAFLVNLLLLQLNSLTSRSHLKDLAKSSLHGMKSSRKLSELSKNYSRLLKLSMSLVKVMNSLSAVMVLLVPPLWVKSF